MDRPLKIGVDIDDVLNDLFPHWVEEWNKVSGQNLNYLDCKEWDLHKFIKDEDYLDFVKIIANPKFYDTLHPDSIAQIVLKELIDNGAEVYLVTGTYTNQHILKEEWVKKHYPYIDPKNILYIPRGAKNLIKVDIMIEDCVMEIEQFNCQVLLLNKEHNINTNISARTNIHRVNDWLNIRQIFVEKYDLLPIENKEINEYIDSLNVESTETLGDKLMKCESIDDFSKLLTPYFDKSYDAGYSQALNDIAEKIKDLLKRE